MRLTRAVFAVAAAAAALAVSAPAEAYPQFQLSTETARCNMCHFSPVGGGLINGWGRDEAADTISRGGDGSFLHGTWDPPRWLFLGGDFRGVAGVKHTGAEELDSLLFPMQADIYSLVKFGDFSLSITAGARGSARPRDPPAHSRFGSREHYVMWRPKTNGPYVRAGRFAAPYGLRHVDHTTYVRRDLGYYAWEETYGVSGGWVKGDDWELHASAFMRDPLLNVGWPGAGGAVMYEKRIRDETAAWGVQTKVQMSGDIDRYWAGGVGKLWLDDLDLLLLTELDFGVETVDVDGADPLLKMIGHINATYFVTRGVMVGTTLEYKHDDLNISGRDSESANLTLQYFPRAHWEIMLFGKVERVAGSADTIGMLMLHYYL